MTGRMDWDDLAYFVCLVEQETLTACAEKMGVQHTTVSRRIERLERALTVKLFDHIGKRYVLTVEGELLYSQAVQVREEVSVFKRMAIDQNAMQGSVVISVPPVLANEVIMPALADFRQRYPQIVLHLQGDVHISDLHQKEADIGIRLKRPTQEDLLIRTLGHVRYGFFAHQDYLKQTLAEQRQFIEFTANSRLNAWFQSITEHCPCHIAFSSNDLYMVERAVNQALGIGILPDFMTINNPALLPINPFTAETMTSQEQATINHSIKNFPMSERNSDRDNDMDVSCSASLSHQAMIPLTQSHPLYLIMHPDVSRAAKVRAVADWLIELFNTQPL